MYELLLLLLCTKEDQGEIYLTYLPPLNMPRPYAETSETAEQH